MEKKFNKKRLTLALLTITCVFSVAFWGRFKAISGEENSEIKGA